jgi:hypothetical protein
MSLKEKLNSGQSTLSRKDNLGEQIPNFLPGSSRESTLHYKTSIINDPVFAREQLNSSYKTLPTVSNLDKGGKAQINGTGAVYRDNAPEGASF